MPDSAISPGALVLYKARPALVTGVADKIEIALEQDKSKRVRSKDVVLLHPGPTPGLSGLDAGQADLGDLQRDGLQQARQNLLLSLCLSPYEEHQR